MLYLLFRHKLNSLFTRVMFLFTGLTLLGLLFIRLMLKNTPKQKVLKCAIKNEKNEFSVTDFADELELKRELNNNEIYQRKNNFMLKK